MALKDDSSKKQRVHSVSEDRGMDIDIASGNANVSMTLLSRERLSLNQSRLAIFSADEDNSCEEYNVEQPHSQVLRYLSFANDAYAGQTYCFGVKLPSPGSSAEEISTVSQTLKDIGNDFAGDENFADALKAWDVALRYDPMNGILHELKAQVYLSLDTHRLALHAVRSAQLATELLPYWDEGFLTLARAQLNMGELKIGRAHV